MKPRKSKILCTIGPATSGPENLKKLIDSGMNAARLNFSHGSHEEHRQNIEDLRKASRESGCNIAIIQDLQGPKIRTSLMEGGSAELIDGQEFIITIEDIGPGNSEKVYTSYHNLVREVKPGQTILLDDGYIILKTDRTDETKIYTTVIKGGKLKDRKGIIAPGVSYSAPSLSDKDIEDLKFGLAAGVDAVALSFVRSEHDVVELRTAMKIFGRKVPIISKIERPEAIDDIEDIIKYSDAIMVARGDLGLEMPAEEVPIIQKRLIDKCNFYGKPVIIATQMLESMIANPRPTRAEASDVANAVIDGADCVMLSGETSIGRYPFDAVGYMDRIISSVEASYGNQTLSPELKREMLSDTSDALSNAACVIARQVNAAAIVTLTGSGYTAINLAKYRPVTPIIALTDNENTVRRLSLVWGIEAMMLAPGCTAENLFEHLSKQVEVLDFIKKGDMLVFVAGLSEGRVTDSNMIRVYEV